MITVEWIEEEPTTDVVLRPKYSRLSWEDNLELAYAQAFVQAENGVARLARVQKNAVAKVLGIAPEEVTAEMCLALFPSLTERATAFFSNIISQATTPKN